jgi:DNA repair photolyase
MSINTVQVKSILQKSALPEADYVINPYTGCVHGCVYCYARFMKRFTGHPEDWGTFLDAKINAPQVLRKQLESRRTPLQGTVFLSSVTDPYQPPEKHFELTRAVLEILLEYQPAVSILTKSDLVLRDLDLLKRFKRLTVGISLMSGDDDLAYRLEPRAVSPSRRLQALRILHENGIRTYAFFSPYLPGLSDLPRLVESVNGLVDQFGVEAMNPSGGAWQGVEKIMLQHYPAMIAPCRSQMKEDAYWQQLEDSARRLSDEFEITLMGFYRH